MPQKRLSNWYLGVMHPKPRNLGDVLTHFENIPEKTKSVLYLPTVFESEDGDVSAVEDVIEAIIVKESGRYSIKDIIDKLFETYGRATRIVDPRVVVVGLGYLAVRHYMQSKFPEFTHMGRRWCNDKRAKVRVEEDDRL